MDMNFLLNVLKRPFNAKSAGSPIWLVDIAELWVDREAEKGFYDGV